MFWMRFLLMCGTVLTTLWFCSDVQAEVRVSNWHEFAMAWDADRADEVIIIDDAMQAMNFTELRFRKHDVTIIGEDVEIWTHGQSLVTSGDLRLGGHLSLVGENAACLIQASRLTILPEGLVSLEGGQRLVDANDMLVQGSCAIQGGQGNAITVSNLTVASEGLVEAFGLDDFSVITGKQGGKIVVESGGSMQITAGLGDAGVLNGDFKEVDVHPAGNLHLAAVGVVHDFNNCPINFKIATDANCRFSGYGDAPVFKSRYPTTGGLWVMRQATVSVSGQGEYLFDLQGMTTVKVVHPKSLTFENKQVKGHVFRTGWARYELLETDIRAVGINETVETTGMKQLSQRGHGSGRSNLKLTVFRAPTVQQFLDSLQKLTAQNLFIPATLTVTKLDFGQLTYKVNSDNWVRNVQPKVSLKNAAAGSLLKVQQVQPFKDADGKALIATCWLNGQNLTESQNGIFCQPGNVSFDLHIPKQVEPLFGQYSTTIRYSLINAPTGD